MELCFTHCRIGTQKSEKKPAGKNSDSVFCNIWAISGFLITFTDFSGTRKSIKFKSLKILWIWRYTNYMEGTQNPWWIRSVCWCLGFVKPFSYIVPALKILGNCSADNFIIKLNMSGWQRLSCLIFFVSQLVHCDSVTDSRNRMRGPYNFLISHPLVPARRLLI